MARTKQPEISTEDRREIGGVLRALRRAAGYRSVGSVAGAAGAPAARPTIYAYERGGLTPSLPQFLELIEFYAFRPAQGPETKATEDLRAQAVAAVVRALALPAYHVVDAMELVARLQPASGARARPRAR